MEISLRLGEVSDRELKFIRQLGVERVDVHDPTLVPGYDDDWDEYFRNVPKVLSKIRGGDIDIASFRYPKIRNALLGRPEGDDEIQTLCRLIEILGENDANLLQVDFHAVRKSPRGVPGRYSTKQRGGYEMDAFSLNRMRKELGKRDMDSPYAHHFKDEITPDEYFANCVKIYDRIIPVLEDSGVKLAIHTDDPPVPDEEGLLPGITKPDQIHRLLEVIPSPNSGILFCTGTRYESGIDIYEQIERFAPKIFHIHFRNVRGTIPSKGGYEEVTLDDGDMDMMDVLQTLARENYEGALNPDHFPILKWDTGHRNAGRAFAVGYIRALLQSL
jgi:mannonate dehydratase